MAGVVGVDWSTRSFAEMRRMWLAKAKHDSRLAARVQWAMYAFGGMGSKRRKLKIDDFDPFKDEGRKRGMPFTGAVVGEVGKSLKKGKHVPKPVVRCAK